MENEKIEEFNQPEWIQVDMSYHQKLEENLEYYKTAIKMIEEQLSEGKSHCEIVSEIANIIEELKEEIK